MPHCLVDRLTKNLCTFPETAALLHEQRKLAVADSPRTAGPRERRADGDVRSAYIVTSHRSLCGLLATTEHAKVAPWRVMIESRRRVESVHGRCLGDAPVRGAGRGGDSLQAGGNRRIGGAVPVSSLHARRACSRPHAQLEEDA